MNLTAGECIKCDQFAAAIVGNIDNRDFMDGRNTSRSPEKLFEDSAKGKRAEIFVAKVLSLSGIDSKLDFGVYKKGVGDDGDVIANGLSIDVKASSLRAQYLIVEESRVNHWHCHGFPNYLCLVAVNKNQCQFVCGIPTAEFMVRANILLRSSNIPGTQTLLKANNYVIHKSSCHLHAEDMVAFIKRGTK